MIKRSSEYTKYTRKALISECDSVYNININVIITSVTIPKIYFLIHILLMTIVITKIYIAYPIMENEVKCSNDNFGQEGP